MLRDVLIAGAILVAGFALGFAYRDWRGDPTRQELTDILAQRISDANDGLQVDSSYVSTSGPMIYLSLPPAKPGDLGRPIGRVEIGHDGEILPSFHNFSKDYIEYHWNRSVTENELMRRINEIEAEYEERE